MSFLNKLQPYFNFTSGERKGIVVLLIVLLIVVIARISIPYIKQEPKRGDISFDQVEVETKKQRYTQKYIKEKNIQLPETHKQRDSTIIFDPNQASKITLVKVGFSEFGAKNLVKYRERGGYIASFMDLNRIYGVDSSFVLTIKHQIVIEPKIPFQKAHAKFESKTMFEINMVNADSLQIIPCIGPVISKRIIKYRSQLGGFLTVQQLKEVYGIDSICYKNISNYIVVDESLIQKLNLNTYEEKQLYLHPYISKYQARAIVKYRELMGPFTRIDQLKENHIFINSELQKLEGYLSL